MRKMKVRGVEHVRVSNPWTQTERVVGKDVDGKPCEQEIEDHPDLRYALKHGDLVACDELTAKLAGIRFVAPSVPKHAPSAKAGE